MKTKQTNDLNLNNQENYEAIDIDKQEMNAGQEIDNPRTESLKEAIAPSAFERGATDYIKVGNKYARNFYLEGFPDIVEIGYLSPLYDEDYDLDISLSTVPRQQDKARKEIQDKLTIQKAQYEDEVKIGANRNLDLYKINIAKLEAQLEELVSKEEKAFEAQLFFTLYADSKSELERNTSTLLQSLRSNDLTAHEFALRQDIAWKSIVPYGIDYVNDKKRNFNTGAIVSSIPFYLPELYDDYGVYLGDNVFTGTPALIDLFKKGIQNSNLNIFGSSGSGKSTLVKALTMRSSLHGIRTVIIDPEREYEGLTKQMHGGYIRLTNDVRNSQMMNIFDIEENEEIDERGNLVRQLDLRSKYEDVLGFVNVIYPEIRPGQQAQTLEVIKELYARFDFIDGDVESLYYNNDVIVADDGSLLNNSYKKEVPILTDFLDLMSSMILDGTYPELKQVYDALQPYRKEQSRGLFDTKTPENLKQLKDAPVITFDVSALESNDTRSVAMYVLLSWIWEKFGKKNPETKKRILVDEAWMMMDKNMKGSEFTGSFLENMSRRIRKRNGSLTIATQKIGDFYNNPQGQAILTNAHTTFLLSHETTERNIISKAFDLDMGVVNNIIEAPKGRVLIKQSSQLYLVDVQLFRNEIQVSTTNNN